MVKGLTTAVLVLSACAGPQAPKAVADRRCDELEGRRIVTGPCAAHSVPVGAAFSLATCTERGPGRTARVRPGGILCSDDPVWLSVRTNERMYLYVVQQQDSEAMLLWPTHVEDAPVLDGRREHRVPEDRRMVMDEEPGAMTIYVVASELPIQQADRALFETLQGLETWRTVQAPSAEPSDRARDHVPAVRRNRPLPANERGIEILGPDDDPVGMGFDDGVAVAVFPFVHAE